MSNNVVWLNGQLSIERQSRVQIGERQVGVLRGHIQTDYPALGGRHAVVISGGAARLVLRTGREAVSVYASGRLFSRADGGSLVDVRWLSLTPLNDLRVNSVWLQGHFQPQGVETTQLNGQALPVLKGWVYTGKAELGGRHPVLLAKKPMDICMNAARAQLHSHPEVIAEGHLLSLGGRTLVQVTRIVFFQPVTA